MKAHGDAVVPVDFAFYIEDIAYNTNLIVEITETTVELISSDDCHSLKNEPTVELVFYIKCNYVPFYPWTPLGFLSLLNVCYLLEINLNCFNVYVANLNTKIFFKPLSFKYILIFLILS